MTELDSSSTPPTVSEEGRIAVVGGRVVAPSGVVEADVIIEDGRVDAIPEPGHVVSGSVIDATGLLVCPGFIDVQINGGFGHDFTGNPESVWDVGERLPASGVTAFLPTIITSSEEVTDRAIAVMAAGPPVGYRGATPIGLHMEGPWLSPDRRGAHDVSAIRVPGPDAADGWSSSQHVSMVTLAPELPGAYALIERLTENGVAVSLGHSNATYEQIVEAVGLGASFGTHLFNAMPPFHHRAPGVVGALLVEPDVTVGVIVDGEHLHSGSVEMAWKAKRPDHLVLVTDAMAAMGMDGGTFPLGSGQVVADGNGPRNPAGDLAGSILSYDLAVRNFKRITRCSVAEAVAVSSTNAARAIGDPKRGRLEVGRRGDVVLVDTAFNVKATIVGGMVAFAAPGVAYQSSRSGGVTS